MGYFKDLEVDVMDMAREGMSAIEIAKRTGLSLTKVFLILEDDPDYNFTDSDVISYDDLSNEPNDVDYNSEHY